VDVRPAAPDPEAAPGRSTPLGIGRRRPSGEPPALPRDVGRSTRALAASVAVVVAFWAVLTTTTGMRLVTGLDSVVVRAFGATRTAAGDDVMRMLHALGSDWTIRLIGWPTLAALVVLRRFHRLVLLIAVTLVVVATSASVAATIGRPRPADVEVIGAWEGYAHPSLPVVALALALSGVLYTLVPAGRWRVRAAVAAVAAVTLLAVARVYLGVDHPTDGLAAAVLGFAVPATAFRLLAPDEVVPVDYRRGRPAHLDVRGRRRDAIAAALHQQMGLVLVSVEPFALSGSAGSTPVRLVVRGTAGEERLLFGKLYATVHLRSDRWYKLTRTVMYGRLEDERSFNSVRRLVEYEDHLLRVARDVGLPTPQAHGFVEITPEREYLLVTEFLAGAQPLRPDTVDEGVIDDALAVVRRMWSAGLAHRDVKPANLLVRDGKVHLIDLAFAAIRPTPWRQAVDLANMMMSLALYAPPELVYERALRVFDDDELAEAFAASRGITVPTQLRTLLRREGGGVDAVLRDLAPSRPPVAIQRWTVRRAALTVGLGAAIVLAVGLFYDYLRIAGLR
jgi:tRNA A-37 threonylcarbamoyl transferase component Bud32/membrane-associated phospholipid phosphatase